MIRILLHELIRWILFNYHKSIAIARWKVTGKRHWVLPVAGTHRMIVMNNDELRYYNRKAQKNHWKKMDIQELMRTALYGTPAGSTMERRRK